MERAPQRGARPRTRDLVEATPDSRNRYIDLIRVVSIGVVVVGHWLLAVLGFDDGEFTGHNLLELEPDLQILTWVFQVMPLFFIVGGFTNGTSWISARTRGVSYAEWLVAKSARLIRPALWFVAFWTVFPLLAVATGVLSAGVARIGGQEVALPLWFLAVYMVAVAAVPGLVAVHRRFGAWTVAGLAAAAFVVDNLRFGLDVTNIGVVHYAFVWLAVVELGLLWRDGALRRRTWLPWAMAVGGLATLVVLVTWFNFPISMIDLTHAPRSNAQPPSLALLMLAVWQCGATLLFEDAGNRVLRDRRPWLAVVVANSMVPAAVASVPITAIGAPAEPAHGSGDAPGRSAKRNANRKGVMQIAHASSHAGRRSHQAAPSGSGWGASSVGNSTTAASTTALMFHRSRRRQHERGPEGRPEHGLPRHREGVRGEHREPVRVWPIPHGSGAVGTIPG